MFLRLLLLPFLILRWMLGMDYPLSDRWRRPLILLPGAKKPEPFTRVTTVARTYSNQDGLTEWKTRKVAEGCCLSESLRAKFSATLPTIDGDKKQKEAQNALVEEMLSRAKAGDAAEMGDAYHTMFANALAKPDFRAVPPYDVTIKAAQECLAAHGIEVCPEYVEQTVVLPDVMVAGSFDCLVRKRGRLYVLDLKTGKDLSYSWAEIAIQLALYSRAKWMYDWDEQECSDMPEVDQKIGLVLWLPQARPEPSLHVVDLEEGWRGAELALACRSWRSQKTLAREARVG